MAIAQRQKNAPSAEKAEGAPTFTNLIDLGDRWLVKVYVSSVQLRTLVGRKITGIAPHPKGGGRSVPTYDVDQHGWLDKWFAFEVPKQVGWYDLSARAVDGDTDEVHIESTQVEVTLEDGVFQLHKRGYGEMIENFGGSRLKKGADGTLTEVQATAENF